VLQASRASRATPIFTNLGVYYPYPFSLPIIFSPEPAQQERTLQHHDASPGALFYSPTRSSLWVSGHSRSTATRNTRDLGRARALDDSLPANTGLSQVSCTVILTDSARILSLLTFSGHLFRIHSHILLRPIERADIIGIPAGAVLRLLYRVRATPLSRPQQRYFETRYYSLCCVAYSPHDAFQTASSRPPITPRRCYYKTAPLPSVFARYLRTDIKSSSFYCQHRVVAWPMGPDPTEDEHEDLLFGQAIVASPGHRLTLQEIYDFITIVYRPLTCNEHTWITRSGTSLARPLFSATACTAPRRGIVLNSSSEYATTDTKDDDDDSWASEDVSEGAVDAARASILRRRERSSYAKLPLRVSASASCSSSS
jgi:hypothetical protein